MSHFTIDIYGIPIHFAAINCNPSVCSVLVLENVRRPSTQACGFHSSTQTPSQALRAAQNERQPATFLLQFVINHLQTQQSVTNADEKPQINVRIQTDSPCL